MNTGCAEIILVWLVVFTVSFYVFLYWRKFDYAGILLGLLSSFLALASETDLFRYHRCHHPMLHLC